MAGQNYRDSRDGGVLDGTSGDSGDTETLGITSPTQSNKSISKMSISSSIYSCSGSVGGAFLQALDLH